MQKSLKFASKLTGIISLTSAIILLVIGLHNYFFFFKYVEKQISTDLIQMAGFASLHIEKSIELSSTTFVTTHAENQKKILESYYNRVSSNELTKEQALKEIVTLMNGMNCKSLGNDGFIGLMYSNGSWLQYQGTEPQDSSFYENYINAMFHNRHSFNFHHLSKNNDYCVHLVGISHFEPWGITCVVSVEKAEYFKYADLTSMKEDILRTNMKNNGFLFIINTSGDIVAHNSYVENENVFAFVDAKGNNPYREICNNQNGMINYFIKNENNENNEIREIKAVYKKIPFTNWIVCANGFYDELFEPILKGRIVQLIIYIFLISFVIVTSSLIGRSISKRIIRFAKGAEQIGDGNLNIMITVKGNDEIAQLANSFNKMVERLKSSKEKIEQYNTNLEVRVRERTKELQSKNFELIKQREEISKQTRQLKKINKELENLSYAMSNTDNAIVIMNPDGDIEWVNSGFTHLFNLTINEIEQKYNSNVLQVRNNQKVLEAIVACIAQRKSVIFETQINTDSENSKWMQTTISPIFDKDGKLYKLISIDSDISKLKLAQNEILQQKEEIEAQRNEIEQQRDIAQEQHDKILEHKETLNQNREKYKMLVENLVDVIYSVNSESIITYLSPSFNNLYGFNAEDFIGKHFHDLFYFEDAPETELYFFLLMQGNETQKPIEFRTIHESGKPFWVRNLSRTIVKNDDIVGFHGVISDISERKVAELKLRSAMTELLTKNRQITIQQNEITASIKYARRIQYAMLPKMEVFTKAFPNSFVLFLPRDIVSGDFYWYREVKKNNKKFKIVALADCTGHGVPGAFMSVLGISLLNEIVNKNSNLQASSILEELRSKVKRALRQTGKDNEAQDGMDIAICIFDENNRKIQYSGANTPILIIRKNKAFVMESDEMLPSNYEIIELKANKNPIGIYRMETPFLQQDFDLQENDTIYMFTDGFPDQVGGNMSKKFRTKNLRKLLMDIYPLNLEEQNNILEASFNKWKGSMEQIDDILVMGIKV